MGQFRDFLSDILFVLGLATVLLSTVQPFVTYLRFMPRDPLGMPVIIDFLRADFSSFKVDYDIHVYHHSESLGGYWFNNGDWLHNHSSLPVSFILIAMFVLQIAALGLIFVTLFWKPRARILPLISCIGTVFLMTWFCSSIFMDRSYQTCSFADGYWWTYGSILCISISIILARGRRSRMMFTDEHAPESTNSRG